METRPSCFVSKTTHNSRRAAPGPNVREWPLQFSDDESDARADGGSRQRALASHKTIRDRETRACVAKIGKTHTHTHLSRTDLAQLCAPTPRVLSPLCLNMPLGGLHVSPSLSLSLSLDLQRATSSRRAVRLGRSLGLHRDVVSPTRKIQRILFRGRWAARSW